MTTLSIAYTLYNELSIRSYHVDTVYSIYNDNTYAISDCGMTLMTIHVTRSMAAFFGGRIIPENGDVYLDIPY
jgi:hypothetical protein